MCNFTQRQCRLEPLDQSSCFYESEADRVKDASTARKLLRASCAVSVNSIDLG